jgi:hypothetical protein
MSTPPTNVTTDATTLNNPDIDTLISQLGSVSLQDRIDAATALSKQRPARTAIGDALRGFNHRQTPNGIPMNRDRHGYIFFTRPMMRMTTANLRKERLFNQMLSTNTSSYSYMFRCMLDPSYGGHNTDSLQSPLIDDDQAFIPMLTNLVTSATGWPDLALDMYQSHPGAYKETFGFVDDIAKNYTSFDITVNFRNIPGDPITGLFFTWCHYAAAVYEGQLNPYPDMIVNNEIDYMTRIYRLVMDQSNTKVQKIAATGASFPWNVPIGGSFNFANDRPFNDVNHNISISFKSYGAIYTDEILIDEFNRTVQLHNPTRADGTRTSLYTKVPAEALNIFNNMGYPRINPDNYHLEWWVTNQMYQYYLPIYQTVQQYSQNPTMMG